MKNKNIHFGCAWSAPDSWANYDASPTLRFERIPLIGKLYTKNDNRFPDNVEYGNIVKGLPISNNSCDYVYCSHVLEHLSLNDCRRALKNTHRIMKNGGVFRLVLPDLEFHVKEYIDNPYASQITIHPKAPKPPNIVFKQTLSSTQITAIADSYNRQLFQDIKSTN